MFPLSHTYVSTKVTGKSTPLLILGSVLPDIATTSAKQIGRKEIHDSPTEFSDFISKHYPDLEDLSLGVKLHSPVGGGADFYSDDPEVGYAKLQGAALSEAVAKLLNIPNGDISFNLAHNFIEMAVDLHVYSQHIGIWHIYDKALIAIQPETDLIARCLAEYLNIDASLVHTELLKFLVILGAQNLTSCEKIVENIALPLVKLRLNTEVDKDETITITNQALNITKDTYMDFLDDAVKNVKSNILNPQEKL